MKCRFLVALAVILDSLPKKRAKDEGENDGNKKTFSPDKTENEGIQRFPIRTRGSGSGLILLFDGEVAGEG